MNQLKSVFNSLSLLQKVSIALTAIAVVVGLVALSRWNTERDFKPLYTGLAGEDAGAVVAKLKEGAVEYRVTEGGAVILVPSARVAEVRLQMAAAGIPKTGRIGYELFDKTNFGATDFTEQVNYHRALEGELERSITSLNEVERARIHLTFAKDSLFLEQREPAKASVMVQLKPAGKLTPQNVMAITNLVANAVEGLTPEGVSLVDMNGNLLSRPRRNSGGADGLEVSDSALEFRQRLERDMVGKISSTLEPVLGPDKFRAGVSIDCDFTSGEQSEESFDPARSVMVTSQKTEDVAGGANPGGVPGSASNLPRPPGKTATGYGSTRRTENIAYQSSRVVRHTKVPQGTVKRMSISVLLDQSVRWEGSGPKAKRIVEPPTPEKVKVIHDLIAGVTGLQPDRGDQLIIESLPFETTLISDAPGTPVTSAKPPANTNQLQFAIPANLLANKALLIGAGVGVGVLLLAVVFLLFRGKKNRATAAEAAVEMHKSIEAPQDAAETLQRHLEERMVEQAAKHELAAQEVLASIKLPTVKSKKTEVLAKQILEETKKDPQAMANVLRGWMNEDESR